MEVTCPKCTAGGAKELSLQTARHGEWIPEPEDWAWRNAWIAHHIPGGYLLTAWLFPRFRCQRCELTFPIERVKATDLPRVQEMRTTVRNFFFFTLFVVAFSAAALLIYISKHCPNGCTVSAPMPSGIHE